MKKIITQKKKTCRHGLVAVAAGLVSLAGFAAFPSDGTYAVLTKPDYNADSLYANTLSGAAKVAVTSDADYGKGFFGSSLTASSKVNRWTLYRNGAADTTATGFFPPDASYGYWVSGKDLPLATPNEEGATERYTFPGKSLTLSSGTITHCSKGTSVVDLGTDVRVVGTGNQYSFAARSSADPQTVGTLTLAENAELLVKAGTASGARTVFGLDWTLNAPASATVTLRNDAAARVVWNGRGDGSKSAARLVLAAEGAKAASEFALYAPYAGVVEVGKGNAAWAASETATFGTLQLKAGGALKLAAGTQTVIGTLDVRAGGYLDATDVACGTARVTDTLTAAGPVRILLPSKAGFDRAILTVPTSCTLTAADFVCLDAADGATLDFATASFADNGDGTKTLRVTDGTPTAPGLGAAMDVRETACVTSVNARVQITVRNGATLDYAPATDNGAQMPIRGEAGATINLLERQAEWAALPLLWVDAAAGETISNLVVTYENSYVNLSGTETLRTGQTICDGDGNPFVMGWADCRAASATMRLWNNRYDLQIDNKNRVMTYCHPRRVRGGLNGHDYVAFDRPNLNFWAIAADEDTATERTPDTTVVPRIFFDRVTSANTSWGVDVKPRAAILVFGSQQGGGGALLGGNANFLRGGAVGAHTKDDAILKANEIGARVWVDGETVEPTTTGLNGGWQVIAIDFGSTTNAFRGLGFGKDNATDNGGQAYAEVMLFAQELTDAQRQQIEWHLATKWGLTAQYKGPTGTTTRAALYGTGTVNVQTDAVIAGAFSGTINLDGVTLTIDGALPPPDATALDTTDLTGWFDPDAEGSLVEQDTTSTAKPKSPAMRVTWLHDRRFGATATDGAFALTATTTDRAPWKDVSAHGFGPTRAWLDYANVTTSDWKSVAQASDGNTLRFRVAANGVWTGNVVTNAFQTLVMAQDSKYGGGQPFVDGNSVLPGAAQTLYKVREGQSAASPIYPAGTADVLTKGVTRLDGETVDGSAQGFRGRPEILTVQPDGTYGPVCFEYLRNSERLYGADTRAAVQGEILMWNRRLEKAELETVEAYLSWKWLGLLPSGYVALNGATLTGAGTVRASSLRRLPQIADGASLAVEIADETTLTFACSADGVADALDLKASALTLPTTCEIDLTGKPNKLKAGDYPLITCGSGLAQTTFTLMRDKAGSRMFSLTRTDTALVLTVRCGGALLIIR